ncbi:hypothetical protein EVAR_68942_1 [Eumeta japonica]|uniref:Uncharacterized protein n=1 Tax=Eumeta variegata TaxID=151549 RepID=A0A4C1SM26_EUMVA|nr:hypothetical protein EVAR_68942_1 [Eumeta japonica]
MITSHNQNLADSCSSLDGDNSSVSGMVISGVEGGVNNEGGEEDDSLAWHIPYLAFAWAWLSQNQKIQTTTAPNNASHVTHIRVTNFSNLKDSNSVKFTQPKLTPKPTPQQHPPSLQMPRVSKEATPQTRSSSTPSPSYPKMKQIPMRKTPYSLRPDRAIPDLEASLSPPPRH